MGISLKYWQKNIPNLLVAVVMLSQQSGCSGKNSSGLQSVNAEGGMPSYSVRISPREAMAQTTLTATVEPDSPGSRATFKWFQNGKPIQVGEGNYYPGGSVRKGDVIVVHADITDIHRRSFQVESIPVTIQNSPPRLTDTPTIVLTKEGLEVAASAADDDGDPVILEYQWMENDRNIEGATLKSLEAKSVKAGNRYTIKVTPFDGTVRGASLMAIPIRTAGGALEILLNPTPATAAQDITAEIKPPRSKEETPVFFEWLINGATVTGETGPVLSTVHFKKKDLITAKAYNGPPVDSGRILLAASNAISVVNSPPVLESVHSIKLLEGGLYETTIAAKDPDGDPVTFILEQGPEGMMLDPGSGLLRWMPPKGMSQAVHIVIKASDSEGLASRLSFDLSVGVKSAGDKVQP